MVWMFFSIVVIAITVYAVIKALIDYESDTAYWDRNKKPEDEA